MKLKVFTVHDTAANAFLPPFYMHNEQLAVRAVTECIRDKTHKFSQHAHDFTLFEVGDFDDSTAKFTIHEAPRSITPLISLVGFADSEAEFVPEPATPNT